MKGNDLKEAMLKAIDIVCDDYIKVKAEDFLDYYRGKEREIYSPSHTNMDFYLKIKSNTVFDLFSWDSPKTWQTMSTAG